MTSAHIAFKNVSGFVTTLHLIRTFTFEPKKLDDWLKAELAMSVPSENPTNISSRGSNLTDFHLKDSNPS